MICAKCNKATLYPDGRFRCSAGMASCGTPGIAICSELEPGKFKIFSPPKFEAVKPKRRKKGGK